MYLGFVNIGEKMKKIETWCIVLNYSVWYWEWKSGYEESFFGAAELRFVDPVVDNTRLRSTYFFFAYFQWETMTINYFSKCTSIFYFILFLLTTLGISSFFFIFDNTVSLFYFISTSMLFF